MYEQAAETATPEATVTAELNQNSAGVWRGSVKVSITAPIDFDSHFDFHRTVAEAEARLEIVGEGEPWVYADVSIEAHNDAAEALEMEPTPMILVPTEAEIRLRESVRRMLASVGATVMAAVKSYNDMTAADDGERQGKKG